MVKAILYEGTVAMGIPGIGFRKCLGRSEPSGNIRGSGWREELCGQASHTQYKQVATERVATARIAIRLTVERLYRLMSTSTGPQHNSTRRNDKREYNQ